MSSAPEGSPVTSFTETTLNLMANTRQKQHKQKPVNWFLAMYTKELFTLKEAQERLEQQIQEFVFLFLIKIISKLFVIKIDK